MQRKRQIRGRDNLTALQVARIKKPGRYADGGSLYLSVKDTGAKSWLFRHGKTWTGLGSCEQYSLAEARERAEAARQLHKAGTPVKMRRPDADGTLKVLYL